jgi:hypothetical protein
MYTTGTFGAGKTGHLCILDNVLLYNLNFGKYQAMDIEPKRNVALYKAPDKLLDEIQAAVPSKLEDRFRIVDDLYDVGKYDILNLDEGYLSVNALDALRKSAKYFIESIVTLRHKGVIIIVNSPDDGILRGLRKKSQFRFYKTLSRGYLYETADKFAKRYDEILPRLLPDQTLFETSHIHFLQEQIFEGVLQMDLTRYCPWYNDRISRSFEGENFDAYLRKIKKVKDDSEKLIELLMKKFEDKVDKINKKLVKGLLWDEYPKLYRKFEPHLTNIVETVKWRVFKQKELGGSDIGGVQDLKVPTIIKHNEQPSPKDADNEYSYDDSCAQFFKGFYRKNLPEAVSYRKIIPEMIYDWVCGSSQRQIAFDHDVGLTKTNQLIKKYRSGEGLDSDLLRLSTVYELFIAKETLGRRAGGKSDPDIFFHDDTTNEIIGAGEVKLIDDVSSTLTFFQEHTKNNSFLTLTPSFHYCRDHGIDKYPLFLRNPKWGDKDLMIPVKVDDSNKVTVSKDRIEEYTENYDNFDKYEFYSISPLQEESEKTASKPSNEVQKETHHEAMNKREMLIDVVKTSKANGEDGLSIAQLIIKTLQRKFGKTLLFGFTREELKHEIKETIPTSLYLGKLDIITDCVFDELNSAP